MKYRFWNFTLIWFSKLQWVMLMCSLALVLILSNKHYFCVSPSSEWCGWSLGASPFFAVQRMTLFSQSVYQVKLPMNSCMLSRGLPGKASISVSSFSARTWREKNTHKKTVYGGLILSILLHGCEVWCIGLLCLYIRSLWRLPVLY